MFVISNKFGNHLLLLCVLCHNNVLPFGVRCFVVCKAQIKCARTLPIHLKAAVEYQGVSLFFFLFFFARSLTSARTHTHTHTHVLFSNDFFVLCATIPPLNNSTNKPLDGMNHRRQRPQDETTFFSVPVSPLCMVEPGPRVWTKSVSGRFSPAIDVESTLLKKKKTRVSRTSLAVQVGGGEGGSGRRCFGSVFKKKNTWRCNC